MWYIIKERCVNDFFFSGFNLFLFFGEIFLFICAKANLIEHEILIKPFFKKK